MVTSVTCYLGFLVFLGLERLGELWLSRRHATALFARGAIEIGQRHYRFMTIFHSAFLGACAGEVVGLQRPFPGGWGWAALAVALSAQALRYWAIAALGERWNVRILVLPEAPPVVRGPYRWVRHPNYVAVILEMIAVPLIHGAWATAVLFTLGNAALLLIRIRTEEQALGAAYGRAFAETPRFLPGGGGASIYHDHRDHHG